MIFEHFGFDSYCTRGAAALAARSCNAPGADADADAPLPPATLVVDVGFSATTCVPIFGGAPLNFATRRLNVGGKLLTNQLKTIVSYRSYNVMEETHLINDVKERLCYVSLDFPTELALTRFKKKKNTLLREFIMPGDGDLPPSARRPASAPPPCSLTLPPEFKSARLCQPL